MSLITGKPIEESTSSGEYDEGTLGIWSTYYDQADPLVIYRDGGWDNLNLEKLKVMLSE